MNEPDATTKHAADVINALENHYDDCYQSCPAFYCSHCIPKALAAAGLLADPTTSRTDAERAVIDAAIAERQAQLHFNEVHQRVLFHGGHPNESTEARRKWDDAANALAAAVDRLAATDTKGETE